MSTASKAESIRPPQPTPTEWKKIVATFQQSSTPRAVWQLVNTFVPYVLLWAAMHWAYQFSIPLAMCFSLVAGLVLVRVFIIFHDCGHGSFLKSSTANDVIGYITGLLTFTPYFHWRWEHSIHHATCGDLDRRGVGDIWTMTVKEYMEASPTKRAVYRVARNPVVLFLIAPLVLFLVYQRFPKKNASKRERNSVWWMNLGIAALASGMIALLGWKEFLVLQIPTMAVAGSAGVWMFYVQHQYEDVYWEHHDSWDYTSAALQGSSFYKLPKILQWFSGNIGFHHIHHLNPRIPNYNLERCHNSHPVFTSVPPITLRTSLKSLSLRLWDDESKSLVGFSHLKALRPA